MLPNGERYAPKNYANCRTSSLVYLLMCNCACFYMAKTSQEFWKQAYWHYLWADTFWPYMRENFLDRVHSGLRGCDWNKILLQVEQRWIFRLHANPAPWLKTKLSLSDFFWRYLYQGDLKRAQWRGSCCFNLGSMCTHSSCDTSHCETIWTDV